MSQKGVTPRRTAHFILNKITGEELLFSELVSEGVLAGLSSEDRARAQRLALDTLRAMDRADRMLKPFLKKQPPLSVKNALRLGTIEIWANGEAAHGVVNACVEMVGASKKTASMKGLVNAVLRKIAQERPGAWERLPEPRLPDWLRQPLISAWEKQAITGIERAHYRGAPLDITAKIDPAKVAAQLGGVILPTGSIRISKPGQISDLPGYAEGDWWVQDAAAAIPVKLLAPEAGEKILDLCAAPGGKTMQLAASGAQVTAVDISKSRLQRVEDNLARTGLSARCVAAEATEFNETGFDAVLVDAPCSATGTIRRHPDLPYAKDGSDFAFLISQQSSILDHALSLVKPGGRLVFCTCSLLPDEGEIQTEEALQRNNALVVEQPDFRGLEPDWVSEEGGIRLRPDFWSELGGMDGFYAVRFRKPA